MGSYFYGPDTYGARAALDELAGKLQASLRFLDREALEQENFSDVVAQSQRGLFGRQLPVVRDPSLLPESSQEALVAAQQLQPQAAWVAWDRAKPDKKSALWRTFKKNRREFAHPSQGELITWLMNEARSRGSTLEKTAGQELVARVGYDRWQLLQELAKLSAVHTTITMQAVRLEVAEAQAEANVFRMLDALVRGNSALALEELGAALSSGESEFRLLALLAYQLKVIFLIATAQGTSAGEIAGEVGLHPFVVEKNLRLSRRLPASLVTDMYTRLLATDLAIKQGKVDARTGVTMLVLGLAQQLQPKKVSS